MRCVLSVAWILCALPSLAAEEPPSRPNIVVIVADDLGWNDVGYLRGQIDPYEDNEVGDEFPKKRRELLRQAEAWPW